MLRVKTKKNSKIIIQVGVKAILFNRDGKFLLLKCVPPQEHFLFPKSLCSKGNKVALRNSRAYWDMPGGRIEGKESLLNNLKREIFEETGLTAVKFGDVISIQEFLSNNKHIVRLTYVARVTSKTSLSLSMEHSEYRWFGLDELLNLSDLDKYLKIILKDKKKMSLIESYINKH